MRPRILALGRGIYHVIDRVIAKEFFLFEEEKCFLHQLIHCTAAFSGIRILTLCIMDNHLHMLVEVPEWRFVSDGELTERIQALYGWKEKKAERVLEDIKEKEEKGHFREAEKIRQSYRNRLYSLADFMKTIKEDFSESFNKRHNRIGPFWSGRYRSILLNDKPGLVTLIAMYIDLNPIRANMKKVDGDPALYKWSGIGKAVRGDQDAVKGILRLRELTSFTGENFSKREIVLHYHALLISHGTSRAGYTIPVDLKTLLETEIKIAADDKRFAPELRKLGIMDIWDLIHCECGFLNRGGVLDISKKELEKMKVAGGKTIKGCRPVSTPIPGICSAHRLRGVSVIASPGMRLV